MKLYCFGQSGHSYKVALYLKLAGIDFEPVFLDFFNGEGRSPEFLALNPMGEAPVLVDGDVTLSQSGVMLEYLVQKTDRFAPSDPLENLRWVLWDNHKMSSNIGVLRFLMNFLPEDKRSADVIKFANGRTQAALNILNQALEGREFLVGDNLTPADLSCASYLWYPEDFNFDRKDFANIDRWMGNIETMNGWAHPYDLMPYDQAFMNKIPAASKWHKEID